MTIEELIQAQKDIQDRILLCAKENKLASNEILPIYDGVCDVEKYLTSSPRIMWILKEPYDDFTPEGKPTGGGWMIYDAFDNNDAWKNRTWRPMIYSTYGVFRGSNYREMDDISDNRDMINVLKKIAYVNISKMPANSQSNDNDIQIKYNTWKPILMEQIALYNPQIIIFGNTFKYFKSDLVGNETEPTKRIDGVIHVYEKDGKKLLDVYHPNQRIINHELYIDSIIRSCLY